MNGFQVQTTDQANADQESERKTLKHSQSRTKITSYPEDSYKYYINQNMKITDINKNSLYSVFISYVEIYNNTVFDLFETGKILQGKMLREDSQNNIYVQGVVEIEVKCAEEVLKFLHAAQKYKHIGRTQLNSESSRSHCIFTIRVVQLAKNIKDAYSPEILHVGQLSLVDLAGSERSNRTQNTGVRLREASKINKSLMSLRICLQILRSNQISGSNRLVPYRESRLTLIFKSYFEKVARVNMIVCVNPSSDNYDENLQVLNFAEMTQEVKVPELIPVKTPECKVQNTLFQNSTYTKLLTVDCNKNILSKNEYESLFISLDDDCDTGSAISRLITVLKERKEKAPYVKIALEERIANFRKHLENDSLSILL